jgi:hypothetical protein
MNTDVPIIHSGTVVLHFHRGVLWTVMPVPFDVDPRSSSLKFFHLWVDEIQKRWPTTEIVPVCYPGADPTQINAANHTAGQQMVDDCTRLFTTVFNRPEEWLVKRNTDESRAFWKAYPREDDEPTNTTEDDPGSEASDPS